LDRHFIPFDLHWYAPQPISFIPLTIAGFLVIYAKFSDIFGAKFMILLALLIFTVFSIACGAATGMTEL